MSRRGRSVAPMRNAILATRSVVVDSSCFLKLRYFFRQPSYIACVSSFRIARFAVLGV